MFDPQAECSFFSHCSRCQNSSEEVRVDGDDDGNDDDGDDKNCGDIDDGGGDDGMVMIAMMM